MSTAAERARRLYPAALHFRRAYIDGAAHGIIGTPRSHCPYRNTEHWAAWREAWGRGWDSVQGLDKGDRIG